MIKIDKNLFDDLFFKAKLSERKRMNYDLRTSEEDGSQRMLNALMPGTKIPIHCHPMSNENVICLSGKLIEILYEEVNDSTNFPEENALGVLPCKHLRETVRYTLTPALGHFGCVIPAGVWHTVEVLEPSVIYEAKDGRYGQDGSESL